MSRGFDGIDGRDLSSLRMAKAFLQRKTPNLGSVIRAAKTILGDLLCSH